MDPMCAYDALRRSWEERQHRIAVADRTAGQPSIAVAYLFRREERHDAWLPGGAVSDRDSVLPLLPRSPQRV
eukprot:1904660-Pleurochrysis_carterae.AAC.1